MDYRMIACKREGKIATITLNRPRALNALNAEMIDELLDGVKKVAQDGEVKVLILTGAGRAFCFGADISEFDSGEGARKKTSPEELLTKSQEIIRVLTGMDKPVIAALNGFATGLGLDLALACDMRVAADRAKLGEAFVSMGLVPDGGGTFFLPRLVGVARAAELIFTGMPVTAAQAEQMGIINRVVSNEELEKCTRELAEKMAQGACLAIGLAKRALWKNLSTDLDSALKLEAQSQGICLASEDHQEAVRAFREKRTPAFRGK